MFTLLIILFGLLIFAMIYSIRGEVFPILVVKSGSMEPVLSRGDVIIIQDVSPENINADPVNGDIIVFYKPGTNVLIVHRAVRKVNEGFITKGDANTSSDYFSPIPPEYIIAKISNPNSIINNVNMKKSSILLIFLNVSTPYIFSTFLIVFIGFFF